MNALAQWIIRHGKIPCNPTGAPADAHDPANWLALQEAQARAAQLGPDYGVGFVFTEADPLWFIDLDACLQPDGQWSPLALELCARFPGAFMEVSQSGQGLHLIGSATSIPPHRSKGPGFDLYTSRRYVAVTWQGAQGNARTDHTAALHGLIADILPPTPESTEPLSDGPVPEWSGPADDSELLSRAMRSRSAASVFGGRASFAQLWTADADALGACWPDDHGGRPFDHSAADAALCTQLAFWAGKDAARIDRLFRESGLVRSKWEDRPDYRERTIRGAIEACSKVYQGKADTPERPPAHQNGSDILWPEDQPERFRGCVYVRDLHKVFVPDGALLKPDQFNAMYGGNLFILDSQNTKTTKSAFEAFTQSFVVPGPKVHYPAFRPEVPPGYIFDEGGHPTVNTYVPLTVPCEPGDVSPYLDLLQRLLPNDHDRAVLLAYMAAVVQYPGVKFQWAPLIQGTEGNGKTALASCLCEAIGYRYVHTANPRDLDNKFNGWLHQKLFIVIEEIKIKDRWEAMEALKPLITNAKIEIQGKGTEAVLGDNRANFFFCSNHKDAILKGRDDRRYCVFFTAQQEAAHLLRDGMGGPYFPRLWKWLTSGGYAHVTHYLRGYPIPPELNPAGDCHRAPNTSSTESAIEASLGPVELEITNAVEEERPGFRGGWISSIAVDKLIDDMRGRGVGRNKRRAILRTLGYDYHPALTNGRTSKATGADAGRPRLYVVKNGPLWNPFADPGEVTDAYERAQTVGG